ncbi:hypothetical protein L596_019315 [Steinernema carpocapsae]|uniref:Uncharacterized protein n=1 Tax=Steinernema carpocapsae TaxID=34508 RepID=A0A4U5MQ75_STECR|nr:hypothetical protein L596_019315 [Steinernema carpocapsae]
MSTLPITPAAPACLQPIHPQEEVATEAQTPTTMQPVRALILLLVAFVGFLAAFPAERQWQNAKFPRRAALLMKRREEQALRNCFFSPVQCLLPINDKALRKFVPHN